MIVGSVLRLQVQRSPLKPGPRGARVYNPTPLQQVDALEISSAGCIGILAGERIVDAHHAEHPETRHVAGLNGLSLLPAAAYDRLRARYGEHLITGSAGESLLIDLVGPWPTDDLLLETDGDPLLLKGLRPAAPCVEFSRFCLGLPVGPVGADVEQALIDLDGGARGYYVVVEGNGTVRAGARLTTAGHR